MIRRLIILLLIVGCGTEPEDVINFESEIIGCWENDVQWDDNWFCFLDNNIYYTAEESDNGYNCSQPLDYKITNNLLTIIGYVNDSTIDNVILTYTFSNDFSEILITNATFENYGEIEGLQATYKWTKWNNVEYTQFCP